MRRYVGRAFGRWHVRDRQRGRSHFLLQSRQTQPRYVEKYGSAPAIAQLQHLRRPWQLIWEKSSEWDINSAQMIWKTQLTFNRVMKCNNTNKCASGQGENKPSLARWKWLKCDNRRAPLLREPARGLEKLKMLLYFSKMNSRGIIGGEKKQGFVLLASTENQFRHPTAESSSKYFSADTPSCRWNKTIFIMVASAAVSLGEK